MRDHIPIVVIVGGGFGGPAAAKTLRRTLAQIVLIDRSNYHVFQPLLYQIATAVLAPGQTGSPIRAILRNLNNITVILDEVSSIDKGQKHVFFNDVDREAVPVAYDDLILVTGATYGYFGHNGFEKYASGLKRLADAIARRNEVLHALEQAEAEEAGN